ncbi:GtrA family protein [Faecalitalea cylindroides]|uniref:GtrA family protein n=1 Tax=Faecalitalea cylindroides TaxID=39483 RepID=UPI00232DA476|nr:GtrA family protein [Faecalitalea cylindroides]MDB7951502.1 GtrA family protein [Faecalitalea cylindroides]MDB7958347.1 GtrA family protein [Faecalitalea cylindroides]MDB7961774.1 GtrA family protein [Faecalitalea cylindroides]MDB7962343.1 GtrA family protein [Faecalitalea cylindroides]MDB7964214.1 GtrA family protein [Faecalitalea cylindroides]
MKKIINQLIKFGVVGGIAFLIDYIILYICTDFLGVYYLISSLISFSISTIFNYYASVNWVFDVDENKSNTRKFTLFIIFSVIGLGINQLIMWLGVDQLGIYYMIVKLGATAIVMIFNFVTRKMFLE